MKTCELEDFCACEGDERETCTFRRGLDPESVEWVPHGATFRALDWAILALILTACVVCLAVGFDLGRP